jgi:hypothetical protein
MAYRPTLLHRSHARGVGIQPGRWLGGGPSMQMPGYPMPGDRYPLGWAYPRSHARGIGRYTVGDCTSTWEQSWQNPEIDYEWMCCPSGWEGGIVCQAAAMRAHMPEPAAPPPTPPKAVVRQAAVTGAKVSSASATLAMRGVGSRMECREHDGHVDCEQYFWAPPARRPWGRGIGVSAASPRVTRVKVYPERAGYGLGPGGGWVYTTHLIEVWGSFPNARWAAVLRGEMEATWGVDRIYDSNWNVYQGNVQPATIVEGYHPGWTQPYDGLFAVFEGQPVPDFSRGGRLVYLTETGDTLTALIRPTQAPGGLRAAPQPQAGQSKGQARLAALTGAKVSSVSLGMGAYGNQHYIDGMAELPIAAYAGYGRQE